jgi:TrmH family RNA methyltransferase
MGAVFRVPVVAGAALPELLGSMKGRGFRILAAEAGGEAAERMLRGSGNRLLVFGSEAHGISPEVRGLADGVFGIRGSGLVESLNVSVAVGIALSIATPRARIPG